MLSQSWMVFNSEEISSVLCWSWTYCTPKGDRFWSTFFHSKAELRVACQQDYFIPGVFFYFNKFYFNNFLNKSSLFLDSMHKHWIQVFVHDNQMIYQLRHMSGLYPSGFYLYHTSFWKKSWALQRCILKNVMTFPVCCQLQWT